MIFAFVGVFIHELCHFIMCKIANVPTKGIVVKYKSRYSNRAGPHGRVKLERHDKVSFLQGLLVALAPLYLSTWFIFALFNVYYLPNLDIFIPIITALLIFSLLIGASPSNPDFRVMYFSIGRAPLYTLYQILLILISGILIWYLEVSSIIFIQFDYVYFILVFIGYYAFKYGFQGISLIIIGLRNQDQFSIKFRALTRRRVRHLKAKKMGVKEAQW